jgi:hypothetical protein
MWTCSANSNRNASNTKIIETKKKRNWLVTSIFQWVRPSKDCCIDILTFRQRLQHHSERFQLLTSLPASIWMNLTF